MLLESMFEQFCQEAPESVMVRGTLEFALSADWVNELFDRNAESQYTRQLTLMTMVDLMAPVVCGIRKSVHSAYQKSATEIGASLAAVYEKLAHIETDISEALVRESAARLGQAIDAMPGGRCKPLIAGYNARILDGNCLGATEHRLLELRKIAAGPLPGKSLVVLDPERMLIRDIFACEDGHSQERSLLDRVLDSVRAKDLWIADRNFCTAGFLRGIHDRKAFFLLRHHRGMEYAESGPWKEIGKSDTGYLMERTVKIVDPEGQWLMLRLVRILLVESTRDGDEELLLLTNLPTKVDAQDIAAAYRCRWSLETAFMHLTTTLHCEINTLGYPKAALFGFCVAVISYNVLAVTRAALRSCHGVIKGDQEISLYHLTDDIVGNSRGMAIALPAPAWKKYRNFTPEQLAADLLELAGRIQLRRYRKAKRGPKKPPAKRTSAKNQPHVSTKRILNARKH
jgi:IS4 transposase